MLVDTTTAAKILGVSTTRVRWLLKEDRIKGAYKSGKFWLIPTEHGLPVIKEGSRGPKPTYKNGREQAKSIVIINRQVIAKNHKNNELAPVIAVKRSNKNIYGHEATINGPCRIIYSQNETKYGARVWIETFSSVDVFCEDFQDTLETA